MAIDLTDPNHATSSDVSRRAFVALGSGAAFAFANASAASAQSSDYGKPHPPIVPEDDPAISVSRPKLTPKAGTPIGAYAAMPRTVTPRTAGIVVTQHIWGVDAQLRDVVRRLAKAGFIAIAPQLFDRVGPVPDPDTATDYLPFAAAATKMTSQGFVTTDLLAGHEWIRSQAANSAIGITGFCMGGSIALQQVIDSKAYAALAMFYGAVRPGTKSSDPTTPQTFAFVDKIATPVLGSFGARDTSIKAEDVVAFRAALQAKGIPNDIKLYDEAGHAFEDDTRTSYVASAAVDAWSRTLAWFGKYLA